MHIAVFSTAYGTTSAAALRWYWLAAACAGNGARITLFHNSPDEPSRREMGVDSAYLTGPASCVGKLSFRALARIGSMLVPVVGPIGHFIRSAAYRYRRTPWEDQAANEFEKVHSRNGVDVIIGVCAPWATAMAARDLSGRFGIPYLVEFQDPWKDYFRRGSWRLHDGLAKRITKHAIALVNVCQPWCDKDERDFGKTSICVPNGFEPSLIPNNPSHFPGSLRLGCLGSIGYVGTSVLNEFCQGLKQVAHHDWSFIYVGSDHNLLKKVIRKWNLEEKVKIFPRVGQAEALQMLAACDASVILMHPQREAHLGSKFPEYVATGVPVVLFGRRDEYVESHARKLTRTIVCEESRHLSETIGVLIEEKASHGQIQRQAQYDAIAALSWKNISRKLLGALSRILQKPYEDSICYS